MNDIQNKRINLKLVGIAAGTFILFTILLVNTIGIIAGAVAFTIIKRDTNKKELWIFGGIVAIYELTSDLIEVGVLLNIREIIISVLSTVLVGLIAVGITAFLGL